MINDKPESSSVPVIHVQSENPSFTTNVILTETNYAKAPRKRNSKTNNHATVVVVEPNHASPAILRKPPLSLLLLGMWVRLFIPLLLLVIVNG